MPMSFLSLALFEMGEEKTREQTWLHIARIISARLHASAHLANFDTDFGVGFLVVTNYKIHWSLAWCLLAH